MGRKPSEGNPSIKVRLPPALHAWTQEQGGPDFVRNLLLLAKNGNLEVKPLVPKMKRIPKTENCWEITVPAGSKLE